MKKYVFLIILFLFKPSISFSAAPEQCHAYFTELVRSSNFPFSSWKVSPKNVNLVIDEDNQESIKAKLFFDTDGTGTIGWVVYYKNKNELFNTSAELDNPIKLSFNNKYASAWQSCIQGLTIYQVSSEGRLYFYQKFNGAYNKTENFIIFGDYVKVSKNDGKYSLVEYLTKKGDIIEGWVFTKDLRKIDFASSW